MGKKSQRNRPASTTKADAAVLVSSQLQLKQALAECSFDRLCDAYANALELLQRLNVTPVSKADMEQNATAARTKMEKHLGDFWPAGPLAKAYRHRTHEHLNTMGGMKITFVEAQGKQTSFFYTVGFASLAGGKELLIQNIHRSMSGSGIKRTLNWMFSRHQQGHHLFPGHTVDMRDGVGYLVTAPKDAHEATLLKATRMLAATRLYGVAGYEILILVPAGLKHPNEDGVNDAAAKEDESSGCLTRGEILLSAMGIDTDGMKSLGVLGHGKTKKLEACAFCHQVRNTTEQKRLLQCGGCMRAFYCCREHQKLDWSHHKKTCQLSEEEQKQKVYEPFTKEVQQAVKDGILPK